MLTKRQGRDRYGPVGAPFREWLDLRGISTRTAAGAIMVSQQAVQKWRTGERRMPWVSWWALNMRFDRLDIDQEWADEHLKSFYKSLSEGH